MRNVIRLLGVIGSVMLLGTPLSAQTYYYPEQVQEEGYEYWQNQDPRVQNSRQRVAPRSPRRQPAAPPAPIIQYEDRDAETILRDQVNRGLQTQPQYPQPQAQPQQQAQPRQEMYDDYYGHRIHDEGQIRNVMAEARYVGTTISRRNGRPFIVFDKRNFQFYLYSANGGLLRIGPVAIGKGRTGHGAFETPTGIFPIRAKIPIDDWIRPDWYFREEGEPIPQNWEDRRVPGFFRFKLVFEGTRYIHYAEATGGRLTHGCLGLDWQDAEAVFHTLDVGSYCVIIDGPFLTRLAKGDFPVSQPKKPEPKPDAKPESKPELAGGSRETPKAESQASGSSTRTFGNMW